MRRLSAKKLCLKQQCCGAAECRTQKDVSNLAWHKTSGVLCAAHPCGIVADIREMYVAESRLQVCAMVEDLWRTTERRVHNFGYDDACHLYESIEKVAVDGSNEALKLLQTAEFFIDAWHLRGHVREVCKQKFNPADRPCAARANTRAAEQAWRYFNQHRHSLRYLRPIAIQFHLLWVATQRNELQSRKRW